MENIHEGISDDDVRQKFTELYEILGNKLKYKVDDLCEIYNELQKNDYNLNGFIGSGAEGPVFAAFDNGSQIAVKVLSADDASKIDNQLKIMERFRNKPYIHQFFQAFYSENEKYFFYITEKLTCDLEHIMLSYKEKSSMFSYTQIIAFAIQMATALSILEKNKIIHSDLKPANILYDQQNKCFKISDYGFAKVILQKSKQMRSVTQNLNGCTAKYAAPEILQQTGDYSCKVDIYSLGLILLELVHGCELNLLQVMQILGGGATTINKYLSDEKQFIQLNKIILSMLAIDRNERIGASELLQELNALQKKEESTLYRYLQARVDDLTLSSIQQLYSPIFSQINVQHFQDTTKKVEWYDTSSSFDGDQSFKRTNFTRARHIQLSQSNLSNQSNHFVNKNSQYPNNSVQFHQKQQFTKQQQFADQLNKKPMQKLGKTQFSTDIIEEQIKFPQFQFQQPNFLKKPLSNQHNQQKFSDQAQTFNQLTEDEETQNEQQGPIYQNIFS